MFLVTQIDTACLSLSFLGLFSWSHNEILLASIFCFRVDLCRHTRILCLPFFSDWVNICYVTFSSDCSLLSHVTVMSVPIQRFGWNYRYRYFLVLISYCCTFSTRSHRWWILCPAYTWNIFRIFFLLNCGLAYLLLLLNDGSDKPSTSWRILCVVGRTWEKLKSV